jgi:hypothetical protein
MQRRDFLKALGAIGLTESLPTSHFFSEAQSQQTAPALTIMQGLTTATTTQISIVLPKSDSVEYILRDTQTGHLMRPEWSKQTFNARSNYRADQVEFIGLSLEHEYALTVLNTVSNQVIDERFLKTVDLESRLPRIAVMSCMNDLPVSRIEMWNSASTANADYYFFIGDVIYGDNIISHGPDKLWSRFVDSRARIPFYSWKHLKPVLGIWDDHDFGKNNAGGDYIHKEKNLETFKAFLAQEVSPNQSVLSAGPGNSFYLKAFKQNFLFLDNRYYRKLTQEQRVSFLGTEQLSWTDRLMQAARGEPTWVLQGSPFFGRVEKGETSYQNTAPEEMQIFLSQVKKWNSPCVFIGGDLHYSEVSELDSSILGYKSYEVISSAMHSLPRLSFYDNPNKKLQGTLEDNFLIFQTTADRSNSWNVSSIGKSNRIIFESTYNIG